MFFEFLQIAIGNRKSLSAAINDSDWLRLFEFFKKQALIGVGFTAVEKLHAVGVVCPANLRMKWMAFTDEDNRAIVEAINEANPDLLWIGMTAPKQEKWTYSHWNELNIHCHVGTIGAVFDFFAGTYKRAPQWWQDHSLEWLYRLIKEPKRMWKRYVLGNPLFLWNITLEAIGIR